MNYQEQLDVNLIKKKIRHINLLKKQKFNSLKM